MTVMRAARTSRLFFRCQTTLRPTTTITTTTTTSGGGGGRSPQKPALSRGISRFLSLLFALGLGLQSAIGVSGGEVGGDNTNSSPPGAGATAVVHAVAAITPERLLVDETDVAFEKEGSDVATDGAVGEWSPGAGKGSLGGDGGLMSPEESADALLADGLPRCWSVDGAEAEGRASGGRRHCLPTVYFIGVSKCGTTSLSDWLSHHPRLRWVRRPQHLYYLEAHVFDIPPDPQAWRRSASSTSSSPLRDRLAVEAEAGDAVIDYTPHYSMVAEVPLRISALYGDGLVGEGGLKFLVVLREPVARTISSWMYKTDPKMASQVAKARHPEALAASLASRAIEVRPLKQAVAEGMETAARLSECVADAAGAGVLGHGTKVTSCQNFAAGVEGCDRVTGEEAEGGVFRQVGQGEEEGCNTTSCETHVEPLCNPRHFLEGNLYDAHVGKSMYALQLARWFEIFGRHSFHVMFTEDLALDPMGTLESALAFLGLHLVDAAGAEGLQNLEEWVDVVGNRSNEADPGKTARLSSQVTAEVVEELRNFFAPHNAALEELLGVPLPRSWRSER